MLRYITIYLLLFSLLLSAGCKERANNDERLLLDWHDETNNIIFRVTEKPGVIVHTFTRLYVEKDGKVTNIQIDDDAVFGMISFVRYENWLLILSDNEVWAGYNYLSSELMGEHMWEGLPFTIRKSKGVTVARRRANSRSGSPASFPKLQE